VPKIRTNRGAAKRFRITGSGKIRIKRAYMRHILTKKAQKRKRQLRRPGILKGPDEKKVRKLIPYL